MGQTTFSGPVVSQNGFVENSFTTAERDAIPNPTAGLLIYNTTTNTYQVYNGSTWQAAFGGGPAPVAPTVTGISPNNGTTAGNASATITGTGFTGATSVSIGGTAVNSFVVLDDSTISVLTGAHSAGSGLSVNVTTPGGTNVPNTFYTYTAPVITVGLSIWPDSTYIVDGFSITGAGAPNSTLSVNTTGYPASETYLKSLPAGTVFTVLYGTGISAGDTFTLTEGFVGSGGSISANTIYSGSGYFSPGVSQFRIN